MATTTIQPSSADARVSLGAPDTTLGGEINMVFGKNDYGADNRNFVQFDLSTIPVGVIESATLECYQAGVAGLSRTLTIHAQITTATWAEGTVTWNNQPAVTGDDIDTSSSPDTASIWIALDILQAVQDWMYGVRTNYGVRLHSSPSWPSASDTPSRSWRAKEWTTAAERPKLTVVTAPFSSARIAQIAWG